MAHRNSNPTSSASPSTAFDPYAHAPNSHSWKRGARLTLGAWLAVLASGAAAAAPQGGPCNTNSVIFSTGYDQGNGGVLDFSDPDSGWTVTCDPDPGTTEPRPATVVDAHVGWKPALAGSRWISSYPTARDDRNGNYCFQTCFCLEPGFIDPVLSIEYRADDVASVFLNGTQISFAPQSSFKLEDPITALVTDAALFHAGTNCIEVQVQNTHNVAMGFDLVGVVSASGVGLLTSGCCHPEGSLQGTKWNDLNNNGIHDAGEPVMSGWTIYLSDGSSTTTDSNGNYYFLDLPTSVTYTVTEEDRIGWTRAYPLSGSHVIPLPLMGHVSGLDFGNHVPCETESVVLNTGHERSTPNVLPIGASDADWTVTCDPDPGTIEPRPADVINARPFWAPALPGSQWISASDSAGPVAQGTYCFERCFCLEAGFTDPVLSILYRADEFAMVFLNGVLVSSSGGGSSSGSPVGATVADSSLFQVGVNCIVVRVESLQPEGPGLDLVGTITTTGASLSNPNCCDPTGGILGSKWNDLNKDGIWDIDEPALEGWTITLSDGSTAVTDSTGHYYFLNVPAGDYTLSEENRAGWTRAHPASGSHVLTVVTGKIQQHMDFGNYASPVAIYCDGNSNCPCMNLGELAAGCVNSTGGGARIDGTGSASVSADDLVLTVSGLPPSQFGLIFMGTTQIDVPFGDGKRCVGGSTYRFGVQNAGPAGTFGRGPGIVAITQGFAQGAHISMGQTWNFQGWFRDPQGPCGLAFNTSSAASVTFTP